MRTIVDPPHEQVEALKQLSDDTKLSRAELVRRAVAEYVARHRPPAFGLWKARAFDALAHQARLRSEWGERRRCSTPTSSSTT